MVLTDLIVREVPEDRDLLARHRSPAGRNLRSDRRGQEALRPGATPLLSTPRPRRGLHPRERDQRLLRVGRTAQGLLPGAQGRAAATRADWPESLDHRHARAAGPDPRRPADPQRRHGQRWPGKSSTRSLTGANAKCGPTSSSTRFPTMPCTTVSTRASAARRARGPITPGEDVRAGRWWWENPESRECGLHVKRM
jgi:hypothetical protein